MTQRGILCRKTVDPCDFPEFCDGIYENCPLDVRSADLEPCNNKTAFCYRGVCRDPTVQCAELFGKCNSCVYFPEFLFKLYYSKVSNSP